MALWKARSMSSITIFLWLVSCSQSYRQEDDLEKLIMEVDDSAEKVAAEKVAVVVSAKSHGTAVSLAGKSAEVQSGRVPVYQHNLYEHNSSVIEQSGLPKILDKLKRFGERTMKSLRTKSLRAMKAVCRGCENLQKAMAKNALLGVVAKTAALTFFVLVDVVLLVPTVFLSDTPLDLGDDWNLGDDFAALIDHVYDAMSPQTAGLVEETVVVYRNNEFEAEIAGNEAANKLVRQLTSSGNKVSELSVSTIGGKKKVVATMSSGATSPLPLTQEDNEWISTLADD